MTETVVFTRSCPDCGRDADWTARRGRNNADGYYSPEPPGALDTPCSCTPDTEETR